MRSDPQRVWRDQKTETSIRALEQVRERERAWRHKTRQALLGWIALPLLIAAFGGPGQQMAMALALVWSLAGLYFAQRGMWSTAAPEPGLASYRRELERRKLLPRRFLVWLFGPLLLAIAPFVAPLASRGMVPRMISFLSLVVVWIGAVFVMRALDQRELAKEICLLQEIEKGQRLGL